MKGKEITIISDDLRGKVIEAGAKVGLWSKMRKEFCETLIRFDDHPKAIKMLVQVFMNMKICTKNRWNEVESTKYGNPIVFDITMAQTYCSVSEYYDMLEAQIIDRIVASIKRTCHNEVVSLSFAANTRFDNITAWGYGNVGCYYEEQECGDRWFILPLSWEYECKEHIVISDEEMQEHK